jgi:hypothetical protein
LRLGMERRLECASESTPCLSSLPFEARSCHAAPPGLELTILPRPPQCWDAGTPFLCLKFFGVQPHGVKYIHITV